MIHNNEMVSPRNQLKERLHWLAWMALFLHHIDLCH